MSFVPTLSYCDTFQNDGVLCLRNALTPSEVRGLQEAADAQAEAFRRDGIGFDLESFGQGLWETSPQQRGTPDPQFDRQRIHEAVLADPSSRALRDPVDVDDAGLFLVRTGTWRDDLAVRSVALDSQLPELMANLLDASRVHLWDSTTIIKSPHTAQRTAFHQDLPYMAADGDKCASAWVALDTIDRNNGALQYVRGSHKWDKVYAANAIVAQTPLPGSHLPRLPDIEGELEKHEILSFSLEPGDIVVHHARTVHGAGGNMTATPRRAMSFRYCGDDMVYLNRAGKIQQSGTGHPLPDRAYLFARDYPVVWPRPWPQLRLADLY